MSELLTQGGHGCPWCPWTEESCSFVRLERDDISDKPEMVQLCAVHGELLHEDRSNDFCWCEK